MERTLSDDEKIRKAEEIYYRRKAGGVRVSSSTVNTGGEQKRNYKLLKKLYLQIAICVVMYLIIYLIQNTNYIFSDTFITKTKEILSYDINIQEKITQIISLFNNNSTEKDNPKQENIVNNTNENINGVGGSTENVQENLSVTDEDSEEKTYTQMEIDANNIKEKYEVVIPLKGTITSRFGERDVEPKNHTGIDIAANTGTKIVSAIDGIVEEVSTTGEYGNHIIIKTDDITTLYAHCSKLLVKEGEEVKKGDNIAEVGNTGNSTGPHLHFEIKKEDRLINPEYVIKF